MTVSLIFKMRLSRTVKHQVGIRVQVGARARGSVTSGVISLSMTDVALPPTVADVLSSPRSVSQSHPIANACKHPQVRDWKSCLWIKT